MACRKHMYRPSAERKVKKLDFGHHGSNHPVEISGIKKALITAQNHGFAVENFDSNFSTNSPRVKSVF